MISAFRHCAQSPLRTGCTGFLPLIKTVAVAEFVATSSG